MNSVIENLELSADELRVKIRTLVPNGSRTSWTNFGTLAEATAT